MEDHKNLIIRNIDRIINQSDYSYHFELVNSVSKKDRSKMLQVEAIMSDDIYYNEDGLNKMKRLEKDMF